MGKILLCAAMLCAAAGPARAETYKWVDENGVTMAAAQVSVAAPPPVYAQSVVFIPAVRRAPFHRHRAPRMFMERTGIR